MARRASAKRILFVAEAVTLAHLARPLTLSKALHTPEYETGFACAPRYQNFLAELPSEPIAIDSISSAQFLQALDQGSAVYDHATLRRYVQQDLQLLESYQPDLVVGDFRISLGVSARVANIPYITISNIYWSPYAELRYPLPDIPMTKLLGPRLALPLFNLARPIAFAVHASPLEKVRREYGLPSLGHDLRRSYTDADITLYADIPGMFRTRNLPANHRYLGSVQWQPPIPLPDWWNHLDTDRPWIFVSLGSSGMARCLPTVFEALADLPVYVIAATAGRGAPDRLPKNVRIADFLPGTEAAARSALVICNGGSPTTQLAMVRGIPSLGICTNMDQYLNMEAIERSGAGMALRSSTLTTNKVRQAVIRLLEDRQFKQQAAELEQEFGKYTASERFRTAVDELTHPDI